MKYFPILFLFLSFHTFSQLVNFTGKILDKTEKAPVKFAHVVFQNTNIGTTTNEQGEFKQAVNTDVLKNKIYLSCLGYKDTLVNAKDLYKKNFYLRPIVEVLSEIVVSKKEVKEFSFGSLKTKGNSIAFIGENTIYAQFVKINDANICCNYLKNIKINFNDLILGSGLNREIDSKVRIRIFNKNNQTGTPDKDLLVKNVFLSLKTSQKKYTLDFSNYDIEVPKEGFFIAFEILKIPFNMNFIANQEDSSYKTYLKEFENIKKTNDYKAWFEFELMDFETYRTKNTTYSPVFSLSNRKKDHNELGKLYYRNSEKWLLLTLDNEKEVILPIEVTLTN